MSTARTEDRLRLLEAARISRRFEARMRELDRRAPSAAVTPEFARLCSRIAGMRPVRAHLARAARRGEFGVYVTRVDGRPVAFTQSGWAVPEMLG